MHKAGICDMVISIFFIRLIANYVWANDYNLCHGSGALCGCTEQRPDLFYYANIRDSIHLSTHAEEFSISINGYLFNHLPNYSISLVLELVLVPFHTSLFFLCMYSFKTTHLYLPIYISILQLYRTIQILVSSIILPTHPSVQLSYPSIRISTHQSTYLSLTHVVFSLKVSLQIQLPTAPP